MPLSNVNISKKLEIKFMTTNNLEKGTSQQLFIGNGDHRKIGQCKETKFRY